MTLLHLVLSGSKMPLIKWWQFGFHIFLSRWSNFIHFVLIKTLKAEVFFNLLIKTKLFSYIVNLKLETVQESNWSAFQISIDFLFNNQSNFRTDWSDILVNHGFVYENRGFNEDPIRKNRRGEYSYTVTPPRFGRSSCTISGNETWRNHPHATVRPSNKASVPKVIFRQAAEFSG